MRGHRPLSAAALLGLVTASLVLQGAGRIERPNTESPILPALGGGSTSGRHAFTDDEYLSPRRFEPMGAVGIVAAGSDSSYAGDMMSVLDSLANSLGRWADSTAIAGQRIRVTICVDPESTRATRSGAHMTIGEVRALGNRGTTQVELASTGSSSDYMGWHGLRYPGGIKPSSGGVTGMSATYIDTWFGVAQDSAASWGIPAFRSHRWAGDRYQPGIDGILLENGYFQAVGRARTVNALQSDHDGTETFAQDAPNYWCWPPSTFGLNGHNRWAGFHGIGEAINTFNLGCRYWDTGATGNDRSSGGAATIDSLSSWIDLAAHTSSMGLLIIPGGVGDSTGTGDMDAPEFYAMVSRLAHRQAEGLLETLTVEQVAARCRGIRDGELLQHHNFTLLGTSANYTNGAITGNIVNLAGEANRVPMGWSNQTHHYDSSADDFGAAGAASGTDVRVWSLVNNADSISAAYTARYSNTDSLSYGLADPTKNVLLAGFQDGNNSRPISGVVVTMGSDKDFLRITGQFMLIQATGLTSADSFYVACKAGQFTEKWEDHLMEGPSSYHLMSTLLHYGTGPDSATASFLADSLLHKERVRPEFYHALAGSDTTVAAGLMAQMFNPSAAGSPGDQYGWFKELQMKSTMRLLPTIIGNPQATEWDYRYTIGNPRSQTVAAVTGHEAMVTNLPRIREVSRWYTFSFGVDIDEKSDYVYFLFSVEAFGASAMTSTPNWIISNISARAY